MKLAGRASVTFSALLRFRWLGERRRRAVQAWPGALQLMAGSRATAAVLLRERRGGDSMKALAICFITLGIVLMLAVWPAFAQEAPDPVTEDQAQTQGVDQGQEEQDQAAPAVDDTSSAPSPTPAPEPADPAAVIAQWGAAPSIGPDADKAVAERWFRDQNTVRARWGVPTATRDPYLDWQAENLVRSSLGEAALPQPQGVVMPAVAMQSPQSDR